MVWDSQQWLVNDCVIYKLNSSLELAFALANVFDCRIEDLFSPE